MTPRERVRAVLDGRVPDQVPRFEIWIDALFDELGLLDELGQPDVAGAYAALAQDCVLLPAENPVQSNAWRTGVDEWGRVWQDGMYVSGVVDSEGALARFSPPLTAVDALFNAAKVQSVRDRFPGHCHIFGTHIGPFTAGYMAMGFERFFMNLYDDPGLIRRLLAKRTEWCIAVYQKAVDLGADALVLGDDAGHMGGPMISPQLWRQFVYPCHRQIVEALARPVIWHSDGNVAPLLPMAIEAGFIGFHGLDPSAGMDLGRMKQAYGRDLALIGNVDVRVLFGDDLGAVQREVDRCLQQGGTDGGFMLATCNSISAGMNPKAVAELFRYEAEAVK